MKISISFSSKFISALAGCAFVALSFAVSSASASADQITLRNGDILNGKVLAMTTNTLTLQDESLGTLTLPRVKVANVAFGTAAAAVPASAMSYANTAQGGPQSSPGAVSQVNSVVDKGLQAMLGEIREHSNLVQEVEAQVLGSSADPAAVNKFNQLLDELGSGQMDMNGLRSEAQNAANELQEYEKQLGPDADEEMKGYLSILNNFLRETAPTNSASP